MQFRSTKQHYQPLDLWLQLGEKAVSAVTGSTLPVSSLVTIPLYPNPTLSALDEIRVQKFRADIDYKMSFVPPSSFPARQTGALGLTDRLPKILDPSPALAVTAIVDVLRGAVTALTRMRDDGNARRGKGTQLDLLTEYDFQNLAEIALAPLIPLQREAYVVKSGGKERTVDFSIAQGRVALELKFAKTTSELNSAIKDAHGILDIYLEHPGVEVAVAVLGVVEGFKVDHNGINSWSLTKSNGRRAFMQTIAVPEKLLSH
uniref:PD-(D/E)XK nuclease domain-containing protein n=1 Tax=Paenarthrobacter nicotinovorans TaxID=29320 RepID=UPI003F498789